MKKDKSYLLLKEPNLYKAFLTLAWPVMLANLLKTLHDLVDTFFIGQMENSVPSQAAIAITWPLLNIFLSLSIGLSVAGVALISQYLGASQPQKARQYSGILLSLSLGVAVLFNILLFFLASPVMRLMGASGETLQASEIYLQTRAFELVFVFLFGAFQATRQARGDTGTPVILSTISILLNIVLTGLFIQLGHMGIFGAALGTVIAQAAIAPACLYLLFRRKDPMRLQLRDLKLSRQDTLHLIRVAVPSAASSAFSSFGFLILQSMILSFGDIVAAAFSIGNKISNLLLTPVIALGSVLAAFVGQNVGAQNPDRARAAYRTSRNTAVLLTVAGSILIYPFRIAFLSMLSNSPETIAIAEEYLFWVLLTQPLLAFFQNYLGVFNGSGNTGYSFRIESVRLWIIRIPLILFFKFCTPLGHSGVWYAMVISNFVILFYGAHLFRKVDFRSKI